MRWYSWNQITALVVALTVAVTPLVETAALAAQAKPAAAPPTQAKPAPAPATAKPATTPATQAKPTAGAAAAPIDTWPRAYTTPGKGNVMVYEPQIASWEGQKQMVAFAAASYQPPGASGTCRDETETAVTQRAAARRSASATCKTAPRNQQRCGAQSPLESSWPLAATEPSPC